MEEGLTAETKALLISIGSADMDSTLLPADLKTVATAGPGAGGTSFFIRSGTHRVRLSLKKESPLKVIPWREGVGVERDGHIIAYGTLELPLCHCPEQAYITVSERCIYNCKFCPVPLLDGRIKTIDEITALVDAAVTRGTVKAISLTSGVSESPEKEAQYMVKIVRHLRERYDLPIGVSIYPTPTSTEDLYAAGAAEIKYNVETMDPSIFDRVCPELSLDKILLALKGAVKIFGRNHVSSNFIIGLGESDACVLEGVETLASMGVIPNLRPISPHPLRKGEIVVERPSPERLLKLTGINKAALDRHGLDVMKAQTMCLPCTGCDLTPHRDL
ncbi:radical SAM protein [Methanosphaerula palustris]|uniref:Radical SAM domain protein n=1 Tax=Methanosphaerula palustris (strain ATCC BAA-1556 / DSM 19958 / E1-9c) TaxID=521011 RepID=B8GHA2_METPE|nr:radical SAM protein [Methanosphaerula palustris]ACL16507.1 Radical SAM domain protein [Methanosphaerula palustris E1-9c]